MKLHDSKTGCMVFSVTLQKIVLPVKRLQDFYRRGYLTPKHKYLHTWQNIGTNEAKR